MGVDLQQQQAAVGDFLRGQGNPCNGAGLGRTGRRGQTTEDYQSRYDQTRACAEKIHNNENL
jgi:hypothetical protein